MKTIINWGTFWKLWAACTIASMMVIPYQMHFSPDAAAAMEEFGALLIYALTGAQNAILFGIVTFIGLWIAPKAGFKLPVLEGENRWESFKKILIPSIIWGITAALLIIGLDLPFSGITAEMLLDTNYAPAWAGLLASFYGGIAEEVLMRLFIMSLLVWIILAISRKRGASEPPAWSVWAAIGIAAILFGLGHLPFTASMVEIDWLVIARAVLLNGVGGIIFGWLFWKRGLVAAIIAHFSADIVLHVLLPIIMGWIA
ncbi:MAG: CPBP family intramembrane metalloprotease [Oscillospiraceae bacterium]|nr:CPBP family intramembrane metalloprotease [Oscillospiraceae bacterium]